MRAKVMTALTYLAKAAAVLAVVAEAGKKVNITDDWHKDNWSSIEDDVLSDSNIYITPDNMPVKIQYVNKISGERIIIDW